MENLGRFIPFEQREMLKDSIVRHRAASISWRYSCAELKINKKMYYVLLDEIAGELLSSEVRKNRDRFISKFLSSQEAMLQKCWRMILNAQTSNEKLRWIELTNRIENRFVDRLIKMGFLPSEPESNNNVNTAIAVDPMGVRILKLEKSNQF